jgi:hypothetical protein
MTTFLFNMFNHNDLGKRSLEDPATIIIHMLRALGHQAYYRPENDQFLVESQGYNIVIEGFTDYSVNALKEIHSRGGRFIILAPEDPSPKGFNQGTQKEMQDRYRKFPDIKPYVDGILHLVPGQRVTDWYSQTAPAAYVELGYAPGLERIDPAIEPTYDFGFFGSLSDRRHKLLKKLMKATRKQNNIVTCVHFPDQAARDNIMRQAKISLQIRKFREMNLVSSSRINTSLMIGRPVIAEPHGYDTPWEDVVRFSETDEAFINECLGMLAFWKDVWRDQYQKFKVVMSPEVCLGTAMRQIGLMPQLEPIVVNTAA